MSETKRLRAAAQQAAARVMREELERAEQRDEDSIRQRVRAIPDSKRYMHSLGNATFEVIDAAAIDEAIRENEP